MRHFLVILVIFLGSKVAAQESADILRKHFKDYGQEQWNDIRSVSIDGRLVDENYYGYKMKLSYKTPNKARLDGIYKGKKFAEAFNGEIGWIIAPWKTDYHVQLMNPQEEIVMRNTFSLGSPLYPFREHLKFAGLQDLEGELYLTFVLEEAAYEKTYYLDKENYRLYYERITTKFGSNSVSILKVTEKYKNYGALLVPTAAVFEGENLYKELIFDQVYVGMGVNDQVFEMPE